MRERPILFSAPMVRAILKGSKTQTRRIVKPPRNWSDQFPHRDPFAMPPAVWWWDGVHDRVGVRQECPYGQPGDRLYVREAWRTTEALDLFPPRDLSPAARIWFETDTPHQPGFGKFRQGMHMPKWASRMTLEVTNVRVERLNDINEDDAYAEGARHSANGGANAREGFKNLWESINGPESWSANPWVWVVSFKRIAPA